MAFLGASGAEMETVAAHGLNAADQGAAVSNGVAVGHFLVLVRLREQSRPRPAEHGLKVGLFRPITLWPFPTKQLLGCGAPATLLTVELSNGQMVAGSGTHF